MTRSNQAPALAVPPASDVAEEQPRSEFARKFLRFLDEGATPGERALIDAMGRLDRELGEPVDE